MRTKKIISLALLVALLTMGPPCNTPSAPPELVLDPLTGLVMYPQGSKRFELANANVLIRSYDSEIVLDSSTTSANGIFNLAHAVPDEYGKTTSGCGPMEGAYLETHPFIAIFSHPDFDTTVVIVGGNPPYPLAADTTLTFND